MNIIPSAMTGEARDCSASNLCTQAPPSCLIFVALIWFRVEKRELSQPPATAGQSLPAGCLRSAPAPAARTGIAMALESRAAIAHVAATRVDWLDMIFPLLARPCDADIPRSCPADRAISHRRRSILFRTVLSLPQRVHRQIGPVVEGSDAAT